MEIFVPGRLCILGEHTDWAGQYTSQNQDLSKGVCIVCATNEGLHALVAPFKSGFIRYDFSSKSGEQGTREFPWDIAILVAEAATGGFFSYVAGTVAALLDFGDRKSYSILSNKNKYTQPDDCFTGIHISNYATTLPMKKGLSSSAAICTLIAKSFNEHYSLGLSTHELMDIAYRGENMTPSRCGRMDQCVVMGRNAIGIMEFDGSQCTLVQLKCGGVFHFVIVDLNAGKNTVKILTDLRACFPFPSNDIQELMHQYVSSNIGISQEAIKAIETGDAELLGRCMNNAQRSFDDGARPNCLDQLSSPVLHKLIVDEVLGNCTGKSDSVLSIKGVGSQGDGSAQILCRSAAQQAKVISYLENSYGMSSFPLTLSPDL